MNDTPLKLAKTLSDIVLDSFLSGEMQEKVTPVTAQLLRFWFDPAYKDTRQINFHEGQMQSILNAIYCHEILKVENVNDLYSKVDKTLTIESDIGLDYISSDKYKFPRYCFKMATGTGKTFVLNALVIWQFLNSKYSGIKGFSKKFLIVAPGIIVYERLLDAFSGKINNETKLRDFETSDFFKNRDLFIPENYREDVFSFIKSSLVKKDDIGKINNDYQIFITNWHIFLKGNEEDFEDLEIDPFENADKIVKSVLPTKPGVASGNSLDVLDGNSVGGLELDYFSDLEDLMVFNDEAHHLGENLTKSKKEEDKKWQLAMNKISEGKKVFAQYDFSATPYVEKGKIKKFFPHIISDFPLEEAIKKGYVKILTLDSRKELATIKNEELDFNSERDESGKVIGLSQGQKIMIEAGLSKLKILDENFSNLKTEKNKHPKMLIMCEDTTVVPFIEEFLEDIGYSEEEFASIHSNKKGDIAEEDKKKVFGLDTGKNPKIVISVLMLREGFDVNNICVIVPLRSSSSGILLEQTIGRGLRLMWRGEEFEEEKEENRRKILIEKKSPINYFDILSIVEHPKFRSFYDDLLSKGLAGEDFNDMNDENLKVNGAIQEVGLKDGFEKYDIKFPIIIKDIEETLKTPEYSIGQLQSINGFTFEQLKSYIPKNEQFISEAVISGTKFGDYDVKVGIMTAKSYNEYISRLVSRVTKALSGSSISKKAFSKNYFPTSQINNVQLAKITDEFIRTKLFNEKIDPKEGNNWKVLLLDNVSSFIIKELISMVNSAQEISEIGTQEVIYRKLSEVDKINVRDGFYVEVAKCIYPKIKFPSNRGGLEKAFIEFADNDGKVEKFCKIDEYKHEFLKFRYIRSDGIPAFYSPDFIVETKNKIYLVETKSQKDLKDENVKRKEKSTIGKLKEINKLPEEKRGGKIWTYALLGEDRFYSYKNNNGTIEDILESVKMEEFNSTLF